jgi:hypothetical protein
MKKKILFVLALFSVVGMASVFAWPNGNPTYALPETNGQIKFWQQGIFDFTNAFGTYRAAGTYRVSGDRLTITFKQTNDKNLKELSGVTILFRILSNGDIVDQSDGSTWVLIKQ